MYLSFIGEDINIIELKWQLKSKESTWEMAQWLSKGEGLEFTSPELTQKAGQIAATCNPGTERRTGDPQDKLAN